MEQTRRLILRHFLLIFICAVVTLKCQDAPSCDCVPYYLCENGTIKTDGSDLIDIRNGFNVCKDPIAVCCALPVNASTSTTPSAVSSCSSPTTSSPLPVPTYQVPVSSPSPTPAPEPNPNLPVIPKAGCGVRRELATDRSALSTGKTYFAELPWMIAVLVQNKDFDENVVHVFKCGGSLIHPRVVLTSAHCLKGVNSSSVIVRAGEWNAGNEDEPIKHQNRRARTMLSHPEFNPRNLWYDIALIVTDSPFTLGLSVGVICLPSQAVVFENHRCLASGWGKDGFGLDASYIRALRKVDLPLVPKQECQKRLRDTRLGPYFMLHDSFICAGGELEKDTCQGDGGGPLVCPLPQDPSRWTQVGIVAWGIGCGSQTHPAVYTNVVMFVDWIISQISGILAT